MVRVTDSASDAGCSIAHRWARARSSALGLFAEGSQPLVRGRTALNLSSEGELAQPSATQPLVEGSHGNTSLEAFLIALRPFFGQLCDFALAEAPSLPGAGGRIVSLGRCARSAQLWVPWALAGQRVGSKELDDAGNRTRDLRLNGPALCL